MCLCVRASVRPCVRACVRPSMRALLIQRLHCLLRGARALLCPRGLLRTREVAAHTVRTPMLCSSRQKRYVAAPMKRTEKRTTAFWRCETEMGSGCARGTRVVSARGCAPGAHARPGGAEAQLPVRRRPRPPPPSLFAASCSGVGAIFTTSRYLKTLFVTISRYLNEDILVPEFVSGTRI